MLKYDCVWELVSFNLVKNTHTRGRTWYILLSERIHFIPAADVKVMGLSALQEEEIAILLNRIFVFVEAPHRG
jgi:hypothetical protein